MNSRFIYLLAFLLLPLSGLAQLADPALGGGERLHAHDHDDPSLFFPCVLTTDDSAFTAEEILDIQEHLVERSQQTTTLDSKTVVSSVGGTTFEVTYTGFTPEAEDAFQHAVDIWATRIESNVTIKVNAEWAELDDGVLGSAGPENYFIGGALPEPAWYPSPLADALIGEDQDDDPDAPDISATFNSDYGSWYLGTDGNTPSFETDFVSVVLHELGHGLGFVGSARVNKLGVGSWGFDAGCTPDPCPFPFVYDLPVEDGDGVSLLDEDTYPNPSDALGDLLQSDDVHSNTLGVIAGNEDGEPGQLYAPGSWQQGSSYSHWDETTYPGGSLNALMTPGISVGETLHDPGPMTCGLFRDMGWVLGADCGLPAPFITAWQTDNPGTSDDDQITIPTAPGATYNYDVNWGDGTSDTGVTGDITHTYDDPGTYTVSITGDFPRIFFDGGGDAEKILTIEQWGGIQWSSMEGAFYGASNLQGNATDNPDLSGVTSTAFMFFDALAYNGDIGGWDVSSVTNMNGMFFDATSFNQDIGGWDVANVTDMGHMFDGAEAFNGDISGWDVSNVTEMSAMFLGATTFNQDIGGWNVSNVTEMGLMFRGASAFNQDISGWDVSSVTTMYGMFEGLTSFNQDLGDWNVSGVTDMSAMFEGSGLSTENYDGTLIGWAGQAVQDDVTLGADGLTYCASADARQSLIDDHSWDIIGDTFTGECLEPPENDNIADAIVLTESGSYEGTNVNATTEDDVPEMSCGFGDRIDVWWSFTPLADGEATISTEGSDFDTVLGLHVDDGDLTEVDCNDDVESGTRWSLLEDVPVTEGETYLIRIAGYGSIDPEGNIVFELDAPFTVADEATPEEITEGLSAPSPNPASGISTFKVAVESGQNVTVEVFDVTGRRVQTLYDGALASGMSETLTLDASALPAGVYVIRATGKDVIETRRVTVVW